MTPADLIILRQALHNAESTHSQRRLDAGMNMRHLLKKYGVEKVEAMKKELAVDF